MRPGERAGLLTPADLRRRRRKNVFIFGLVLATVLISLVATVLAVNNGRNYRRLVRQAGLEHYLLPAAPPPRLRVDRQRQIPPRGLYPSRLLQPRLERGATFLAAPDSSPSESCDNLDASGKEEASFKSVQGDWECLFYREFGSAPEPASLFIQARGSEADNLRTFRIKLSLTDSSQDRAVVKAAMESVNLFGLALSPESRAYLSERLPARREFNSVVENYRMTFSREMTDERRFNLLILPRPMTAGCDSTATAAGAGAHAQTYHLSVGCLALRPGTLGKPQS
ncbi:hypothetical protein E2F50_08775 [Rhizobium deserti]|uniref:Exopolysaccharide biosynthesis protein n=1 Tax=Rhizobium deserti TaxID=2547961 RepID=A0A4R5UJF3_9HYPH|nr:DUF6030 family protein [Rhizobium deserti]TDK36987.1 hypothetical protein E2F50_08775 [Rhizobium deserti]